MKLRELIHPDAIVVSMKARDRDGVIAELVASLVAAGAIQQEHADEIQAAVIKREKSGSTGFGKGVAAPHVKHPKVQKPVGAIGLSAEGIDFKALDQKPVFSVFLILSPTSQEAAHLHAMEIVFRALNRDMFRRFLRQATDRKMVLDLLEEADSGTWTKS